MFTTLVRFDAVYVGHFKCNIRRIEDYSNLPGYLRDLYQTHGVKGTVNLIISRITITAATRRQPTGIVPVGLTDFDRPHGRDKVKLRECYQ